MVFSGFSQYHGKMEKMKLGDFCIEAVRREGGRLPADLVSGCAALEQYGQTETFHEATDVYGFTASLFYALTGTLPEKRLKEKKMRDCWIPTGILKRAAAACCNFIG